MRGPLVRLHGNFAGPLLVVGGRRRGARRDSLAAGLGAGPGGNEAEGIVGAAGAPVAPVHEHGALPELRGPALARRLGGPAAPQSSPDKLYEAKS